MIKYSIADIEKLSGIKAHTVRMWEKRYGIVCPKRSEGNTRYYTEQDMNKMLNIATLNKHGLKISAIAKMCAKQIEIEAAKYVAAPDQSSQHLDTLLQAVIELDEYKVNAIIDHCVQKNDLSHTMEYLLYPLLDNVSMMLITGRISNVQEVFLVSLIRRKLIGAINEEYRFIPEDAVRFMLYLPEEESHELSMLYVHLLLLERGALVLNLGMEISVHDVIEAHDIFKPTYVFTMFNEAYMHTSIAPYIVEVSRQLGDTNFLISGYSAMSQHFDLPPNVKKVLCLKDVYTYVCDKKATN